MDPIVNTAPPAIAFTKNAVPFLFKPGNYFTAGIIAVERLVFAGNFNNAGEDSFNFTWANGSAVFTVGTNFPAYSGSLTVDFSADAIAALQANALVNRDYIITSLAGIGTITLVLTAKNSGIAYNWSAFATTTPASLIHTETAGTDDFYEPNYSMPVQLKVEKVFNSGVFADVSDQEIRPYYDGTQYFCYADFADAIKPYFKPLLPTPGVNGFVVQEGLIKRYELFFQDKYGTPIPADQTLQQSGVYLAANTGLTNRKWNNTVSLTTIAIAQGNYLHNGPLKRKTRKTNTQYLYCLNTYDGDDSTLKAFVRVKGYYNGAEMFVYPLTTAVSFKKNQVGIIAAGYNQVEMDDHTAGADIDSYSVQLISNLAGEVPLTDEFFFETDTTSSINETQLLFENSLGGFDTLVCTGFGSKSSAVTKIMVALGQLATDVPQLPSQNTFMHEEQQKFIVQSGYKTRSAAEVAGREIMLSENKYEINDDGFTKIIVTADELPIEDQTQHGLYFLTIPYQYAFISPGY